MGDMASRWGAIKPLGGHGFILSLCDMNGEQNTLKALEYYSSS